MVDKKPIEDMDEDMDEDEGVVPRGIDPSKFTGQDAKKVSAMRDGFNMAKRLDGSIDPQNYQAPGTFPSNNGTSLTRNVKAYPNPAKRG